MFKPMKRKKCFFHKISEDEAIVYNPDTKYVHVLNQTASFVWQHCDGSNSIDDILKNMKKGFDISSNERSVQSDISKIVNRFKELELVK